MKKLLMGTLAALLVALSGTLSAHAITYTFAVPANPQGGSSLQPMGGYTTSLTTTNNTVFDVLITAQTGPTTATAGTPNFDVQQIQLSFFNPDDNVVGGAGTFGGTSGGAYLVTPTSGTAPGVTFQMPTGGVSLGVGSPFTGRITLQNAFTSGLVNVSLTNNRGPQFRVEQGISATPEMPGSVLALASMLPMVGGVVLRKRGSRKSA